MSIETNRTIYYKVLGVKDDEIVLLEEINDFTCCSEKSGQVHVITMRPITQEQIDYSWSEDNMEEYWKMAVESGHTYKGLYDWIDSMKCEYDQDLPYFDDNSYRDDTEQALDELEPSEKEQVLNLIKQACEEMGSTYVTVECSTAQHMDAKLDKSKAHNFHIDSFQYATSFFKNIFPIIERFSKGEIDYNTCVDMIKECEV